MEVFSTNELEVLETKIHIQKLYIIVLKFLAYFTAYVIIPFYIFFTAVPIFVVPIYRSYINPIISDREPRFLVWLVIVYVIYTIYKKVTFIIFSKLKLNLKIELRNYLAHKGWKISYYKYMSRCVRDFNRDIRFLSTVSNYGLLAMFYELLILLILSVGVLFIILSMIFWSYFHNTIFEFDIWKSEIFIDYISHFNTAMGDIFIFFLIYIIFITITIVILATVLSDLLTSLIKCIFPVTNLKVDASDFPLSFIKKAIEELEDFEFSDSFEQRQNKKNHIVELIVYAIDIFIKVDNESRFINNTNICYTLFVWNTSNTARFDVLFRTNGLYKKLDQLCASINNMNNPEEQSRILQELKKYLKVIEDRDLSKIDPVEYKIAYKTITDDTKSPILQLVSFITKIL